MPQKLFVYGTLGLGSPNEHVLQKVGGTWEKATVRGKLVQEGWGAAMGYPAIVLDEEGETVEGFVFTSENLEAHWAELDEFEGEAYKRILIEVELSDQSKVEAFIYALKSDQ